MNEQAAQQGNASLPDPTGSPWVLVREVMTEPFISVRPMATAQEVARVLRSNHIRVAPVLTAEGRLVGVISETDLTRAALRAGPDRLGPARRVHLPDDRHDHRWLARDLMSAWIVDVSPTASLAEAARIMRAKRVSWLPVVDDRRHLVGVLSQSDVLNRAPIRARHMGTAQQSTGPESNSP